MPGLDVSGLFDGAPGVRVAAAPTSTPVETLLAEEQALVARAVEVRRREFATGRRLARTLLAEAGWPEAPLLRDADRVPLWPEGALGCISHTREWCVVAVASCDDVTALGVDVEPDTPLEPALWPRIATHAEREWLSRQPEAERGRLAHGIFVVKECVYKAAFPSRRERWGFQDVETALEPIAGRFRAETPGFGAGERRVVEGRLLRRDGQWLAGLAEAR